jgi:indolepyruvate ferredoxin oxidoreductase beta subunit
MTKNVILAGVGGQGLLSIAAVLGEAARLEGLHLKQAEVHGMAQRGGVVQSHVRFGDRPIHSDLIREGVADLILALEPMEALRYLPFLRAEGIVIANRVPLANIPNYPDVEQILAEIERREPHLLIDAQALAQQAGSVRCTNMVMLGASAPFLDMPEATLLGAVEAVFEPKGADIVETNLKGFRLGRAAAEAT